MTLFRPLAWAYSLKHSPWHILYSVIGTAIWHYFDDVRHIVVVMFLYPFLFIIGLILVVLVLHLSFFSLSCLYDRHYIFTDDTPRFLTAQHEAHYCHSAHYAASFQLYCSSFHRPSGAQQNSVFHVVRILSAVPACILLSPADLKQV